MRASQGQAVYLKSYREPDYSVPSVDLDISLDANQTIVKSRMVVERNKQTTAETPVVLDGDELKLVSVSIEGKALSNSDFSETATHLTLKKIPKKRKFEIEIVTELNPATNTKLMGLYQSGGNFCTQCEAEGFRRITYFPDRPDILSVYTTRIEGNRKTEPILLGNGNLIKRGSAGKGRHFAIWHDPHPKPSYLFALVGGALGSLHRNYKTVSGRPVKLGIYVQKGKEASAEYALDALIRSMRWDEEVFGCEYDLDIFNIVAIPDFNMGAMENKGLNIFNDKYVLADPQSATDLDYENIEAIIAHEYFHNWTGNRITCRDWFQLCLKEGLTVYRDQEFSSDQRSRSVKRIDDVRRLKAHQFPEDAGPLAHPVRPEMYREINNFYTTTVYEKGAELVRMIATILGQKKFRKGMDLYFKRHDGEATTIEHFLKCFEDASKTDLTQFALWYSQAGTPCLTVSTNYDKSKSILEMDIEQMVPPTPGQRRKAAMHIPQRIALFGNNGSEIAPIEVNGAENTDNVLHLTKRNHSLKFKGIHERPVVSINRGFAAPINVNYHQSNSDLGFLAAHDSDLYNRWQAYQDYASRLLISSYRCIRSGSRPVSDQTFLESSLQIAVDEELEPAFRTSILTLPSETDLSQSIGKNVDPDAVHKARTDMLTTIGKHLDESSNKILKKLKTPGTYNPDAEDAGKRSLKNLLLAFGIAGNSKSAKALVLQQFSNARNMTDRFAALQMITHGKFSSSDRKTALDKFYERYHKNHLVLDKWFSVQATRAGSATASTVSALMRHEDFSLSNPNRVRSLVGAFAGGNPSGFNAASGKGYKLVAGSIGRLDKLNPQVAARLLTVFRSYRSLEPARRKLAEHSLKELRNGTDLSRDVQDILDRILSED